MFMSNPLRTVQLLHDSGTLEIILLNISVLQHVLFYIFIHSGYFKGSTGQFDNRVEGKNRQRSSPGLHHGGGASYPKGSELLEERTAARSLCGVNQECDKRNVLFPNICQSSVALPGSKEADVWIATHRILLCTVWHSLCSHYLTGLLLKAVRYPV